MEVVLPSGLAPSAVSNLYMRAVRLELGRELKARSADNFVYSFVHDHGGEDSVIASLHKKKHDAKKKD